MVAEAYHDEESPAPVFSNDLTAKKSPWWASKRLQTWFAVLAVLSVFLGLFGGTDRGRNSLRNARTFVEQTSSSWSSSSPQGQRKNASERQPLKHLLIPASNPSPELCKLLLTASALKYPHPHLLAWNATFDKPNMMAGGSHIAKIHRTLDYLNRLGTAVDNELVLMVDGYDIWFQLPPEVFASRYYDILEQSDSRMAKRFGKVMGTVRREKLGHAISSRIVFGTGKRCAPNQPHTIACYTIPDSPLSDDLYGGSTDTPVGRNKYYSYKQRYLNSGYIIGPVGEMRRMFKMAEAMVAGPEKMRDMPKLPFRPVGEPSDNGSGGSEWLYHGSDQSVFAKIWGRQEYIREVLRRRWNPDAATDKDEYMSNVIEGTKIKDILEPDFPHEKWKQEPLYVSKERYLDRVEQLDPWKEGPKKLLDKYDFGITMDYFSDLGHQTVNSETDATWLIHGQTPLASQIDFGKRNSFDCPLHLPHSPNVESFFPSDVLASEHPIHTGMGNNGGMGRRASSPWLTTPLYTHLCFSGPNHVKIPAMIHHNGDKGARQYSWHHMSWLYDVAKPLLRGAAKDEGLAGDDNDYDPSETDIGKVDEERQGPGLGGAWTDKGFAKSWDQLCPARMVDEAAIFGRDR